MRIARGKLLLAVGAALGLVGCAAEGPPRPPSLDLPKPPVDLRAERKGDRVILTWSVPALTTDRATVRSLGPTRICRTTDSALTQCGTAVGEVAAGQRDVTASTSDSSRLNSASSPGAADSSSASSSSSSSSPASHPKLTRPSFRPNKVVPKIEATYADSLFSGGVRPDAAGFATYAVEVLNANGRGAGLSNQVRVPLVATLAAPADFAALVTGQGVVLSWRAAAPVVANPSSVSYVYRVYRRVDGGKATLVGEVPAGGGSLSLTDANIEWEETYYYRAEAVTVIAAGSEAKQAEGAPKKIEIEGDDSAEVKVFAHDVFPPAVPAELQAVFSGPGQQAAIDLVWAPVTDVDLAGYNVYRREDGGVAVKLNGELVKTPAYRDASVAAGKAYLYSVSAVDVRGNESARSEEAGERVP